MIGKENRSSYFFPIILTVCLTLFLTTTSLYSQDFLPAQVKDISDRAYEPAVIKLLDGATESIVISMYIISLGTEKRNPVRLLLEDLMEAKERGVDVILYLNTSFKNIGENPEWLIEDPIFKKLQDAGCIIHLRPNFKRFHDKLIIVDSRYVVEGSTNWSISALRNNFESNTLIDSPGLAKMKLLRLKMLPLETPEIQVKEPHRALYIEELPDNIELPKGLLLNEKYFPWMLTREDERCMNFYLLLLAHSQVIGKKEFFINMEAMGLSLGMPDTWSDSALRRQVIRSLNKLKNTYHLIQLKFFHGKDTWVKLIDIPGETFAVSSELIKPDSSKKLSMRLKFLLIVKALLESQDKDIYSMSHRALAKQFHVHHTTINEAFKELLK